MVIQIRPESVDHPELMPLLKSVAIRMCEQLGRYGIHFADNRVKIWIKQYGESTFFMKIEFDLNNDYELQYDISREGTIHEAHFKLFSHDKTGAVRRRDIEKSEADPFLQKVDDILRYIGY